MGGGAYNTGDGFSIILKSSRWITSGYTARYFGDGNGGDAADGYGSTEGDDAGTTIDGDNEIVVGTISIYYFLFVGNK